MRYVSSERWNKLPILKNDYRPRFFVELYQEILNTNTPSSYQARTMNIFSYAIELSNLISNYQATGKNKSYIVTGLKEFCLFLDTDMIAQSVFSQEVEILLDKFQCNELQDSQIYELNLVIKLMLDVNKKQLYWQLMTEELINAVCGEVDLKHIKRNLDRINLVTRLFVIYLLNDGFSNVFLFNRVEMFTQFNNYSNKTTGHCRTFKEQLKKIIDELYNSNKTFTVNFLISSFQKIEHHFSIKGIVKYKEFSDKFKKYCKNNQFKHFDDQVNKYHGEMTNFYIISFDIESSSYANALLKTKEKLLLAMDVINVILKVQIHPIALVETKNKDIDHVANLKYVNINKHLDDRFFLEREEFNLLVVFQYLDSDNIEKLKNSIRYFRLAKESISIEQRILNTWIALETLYTETNQRVPVNKKNIVSNVIEYVPMIYNSFSIIRKVRYIKGLLADNKVRLSREIKEHLGISNNKFDKNIADEHIWTILRDKKLFISLMKDSNIKEMEHLKYRCTSIFDFVCNKARSEGNKTKPISEHFKKSKQSVENQLYRLYMIRNKIAHQGHYSNINPQLVNHLTDYLLISYAAISIGSTYLPKLDERHKYSLLDILNVYKYKFEVVNKCIKSDSIIDLKSVYVPRVKKHMVS